MYGIYYTIGTHLEGPMKWNSRVARYDEVQETPYDPALLRVSQVYPRRARYIGCASDKGDLCTSRPRVCGPAVRAPER